jgi:hypothetical protein
MMMIDRLIKLLLNIDFDFYETMMIEIQDYDDDSSFIHTLLNSPHSLFLL